MSFLAQFFAKRSSAPIARDRLQILLAHERSGGEGHSELIAKLREEILEVIARHVPIDRDKVQIKLDRGAAVSTLEIDIEVPGLKEQALKEQALKDKDKLSRNGVTATSEKTGAADKAGPAEKAGSGTKLDPASGTRSLPTGP